MDKKLSIITTYPLMEEPVIRNRLLPFINEFLCKGYSVDLFQPSGEKIQLNDSGFNVHFVAKQSLSKKKFIMRAFSELSLCYRLVRKYKKQSSSSNVVLVTIPSMFLLLMLPFFKHRNLLLDVRDLTWEYLSEKIFIQNIAKKIFRKIFSITTQCASSISVTNTKELEYCSSEFLHHKSYLVTNGITQAQFENLSKIKDKTNGKNRLTVTYIGNVGIAQDLSILVKSAYNNPSHDFYIVGGGNDLDRISNMNGSKLDNLFFVGRVDSVQVNNYYEQSDILFAQLTADFNTAIPSKLYEYLSTGKIIIYGGSNHVQQYFKNFSGIYYFNSGNLDELNDLLYKLKVNPPKVDINKNKSLLSENFIRERAVEKYLAQIGIS